MNEKFQELEMSQKETMNIIKSDMSNLNNKFDEMMEMLKGRSTAVASEGDGNSGKH